MTSNMKAILMCTPVLFLCNLAYHRELGAPLLACILFLIAYVPFLLFCSWAIERFK